MERKNNMGREYGDDPGEFSRGDVVYAVRKFLNDAHDYVDDEEYEEIKRVMHTFLDYIEEL